MRDAIGGLTNVVIIVAFLVIVSGYLAFNVNYTKAFRVKNKIISTVEQYEGYCPQGGACDKIIVDYMKKIGYKTNNNLNLTKYGYECVNGYCIKETAVYNDKRGPDDVISNIDGDIGSRVYYNVVTCVVIDIPIINKVLPNLKLFQVSGTTHQIVKP